ncbi:MAG: PDZ domain-containing protein [Limisphaerales bacterium]
MKLQISLLARIPFQVLAFVLAFVSSASLPVYACTIFVLTDTNRALFCNNEDWSDPKTRIWFLPAGDGYYGAVYVGFDHSEADGQRSYRYRLEFQKVTVLEHLVFDGQNKCVSGGPEALEWKSSANAPEVPTDAIAGIGVVLGIDGEYIIVRGIVPDSPAAAQKDIHVGDRIMGVAQDKEPAVQVQSGQLAQAVALIRGAKGTKISLTIVPVGEDDSRVRVATFVRGELKALPP